MGTIYSVRRPRSVGGVAELVRGGVEGHTAGHPAHFHSEWQLVAVTRGDGWVKVPGGQCRTPGGSLFLIPPEVVHSNGVMEVGCHFRSMLIDGEVFSGIAAASGLRLKEHQIAREPVLVSTELTRRFDQFHRQLEGDAPSLQLEDQLAGWVEELLGRQTGQCASGTTRIAHPAARRARECLWDRAEENIPLEALAREAGLSRFELCRQFKAAYGLPPHAWQLQARIERSKGLLKAGVPASEAALRLGFADQAHFCRVFRRATGYTPSRFQGEFRNSVQERPSGL